MTPSLCSFYKKSTLSEQFFTFALHDALCFVQGKTEEQPHPTQRRGKTRTGDSIPRHPSYKFNMA
jgi:hypothetical protein